MSAKIGMRFRENMYGHYKVRGEPADGPGRRFDFHYEVETRDLLRWFQERRGEATGWVEAEGLAAHAELSGYMVVEPFVKRRMSYEFQFTGDDGRHYRFVGHKAIRHLHAARTWTTLYGTILDDRGTEWAETFSRFRYGEIPPFLASFRFPFFRS